MVSNKHIYNRFEYWSVDDCACCYCINYKGKNRPCPLKTCCIEDIRNEAIRRENTITSTCDILFGEKK